MTGAVCAAVIGATAGGGGGGGGGNAPNAMAWANIYAFGSGNNAPLTVSGVGAGQTSLLSAAITGAATLTYIKNGVAATYTGAFTVADGDKIAWGVFGNTTTSGTVTVTSSASAVGSFTYIVKNPGGGGYL